ncbi:tRNA U-34 5-methylaminomethyl-2-thiouridine biosynthesis protein [Fictibacillus arsenicus]|uniref:tRNA U-34 5-methylaminomethyl-2-thiouridine biosynthesis protein n=1 Tax=Fictibacillus arsenicus TaxID=255247 RepID=UPI0011159DD0|nr:tRNA U-34 5-methylaminomethyl-2-thiouridine biosynthesis protein [Fictibacillus arsenicus]
MKNLLLAILGAIAGWLLWGLFTKHYETDSLLLLIFGIFIGHSIGKKESFST